MPAMTPQERVSICGRCTLARCNERSPSCLIQIERRGADVGRKRSLPMIFPEQEARREAVLRRGVGELLAFRRITPDTMQELMSHFKKGE